MAAYIFCGSSKFKLLRIHPEFAKNFAVGDLICFDEAKHVEACKWILNDKGRAQNRVWLSDFLRENNKTIICIMERMYLVSEGWLILKAEKVN